MPIILQSRGGRAIPTGHQGSHQDDLPDGVGGTLPRLALAMLSALIFSALVGGCAIERMSPPEHPDRDCQSAEQCTIPVEVDCDHSPCRIKVTLQSVAAHGFAVVWEIVQKPGQSYRFANPGGVFFKTPAGQNAFRCQSEANDKRYRCMGNRDGKTYEYGIELVGTPPVKKLDPWIVNN